MARSWTMDVTASLASICITSFWASRDCMAAWRVAGTLIRDSFPKLQLSSQSLHRRYLSVSSLSSVDFKMNGLDSRGKLEALRMMMKERQLDAYVVPTEDAHSSEYIAPCDARRAYLTSFTGSAGTAVITQTKALCWTDGRYFLQAEKQLGEGWTLMKSAMPNVPTWQKWLQSDLPPASRVCIDPTILPHAESSGLITSLAGQPKKSSLIPVAENLVDRLWSSRPARPANPIFRLDDHFTGENVGQKLHHLREHLAKAGSPGVIVTALDEVAWLFNLRGSDIPYNPVFFGYAIVTPEDCTLFVQPTALDEAVREYLHANGVAVLDYESVWNQLQTWGERLKIERKGGSNTPAKRDAEGNVVKKEEEKATAPEEKVVKTDKVLIGHKTSWAVVKAVGEENIELRKSPVEEAKAKKNATEVEGFRQCNIRDGVALVRYFSWLEEVLQRGETWTEYDAAQKLEAYRRENKLFMGLSFETISSTGPNAAVIHYSPPREGSSIIALNEIYLCDSGAQYLDGTTDTTRTLHFGNPSSEQRRAFTRVLQGHIALDTMIFPQGTTGYVIDAIARRPLWSEGLDYRHGTGHGVGAFLNVHEGPHGIGQRPQFNEHPLRAGNVVSNEPGYYADGKFGIRIENCVVVKPSDTPNNFGNKGYLEFEHVTMCPMQTKLVMPELLLEPERRWLNEYHAEVLEKLIPLLKEVGDSRALSWLERECAPI